MKTFTGFSRKKKIIFQAIYSEIQKDPQIPTKAVLRSRTPFTVLLRLLTSYLKHSLKFRMLFTTSKKWLLPPLCTITSVMYKYNRCLSLFCCEFSLLFCWDFLLLLRVLSFILLRHFSFVASSLFYFVVTFFFCCEFILLFCWDFFLVLHLTTFYVNCKTYVTQWSGTEHKEFLYRND